MLSALLRVQDLGPEHVVRLAQCLEMHVDHAPIVGLRLLDALAQHTTEHTTEFSPAQLAQLLCAHAALRYYDGSLIAAAAERAMRQQQPNSSSATSQQQQPDSSSATSQQQPSNSESVAFSTPELVDLLWASVSLGDQPAGAQIPTGLAPMCLGRPHCKSAKSVLRCCLTSLAPRMCACVSSLPSHA